ncbi:MAG: GLPGLI family protein [Bacteroidia bacterium]|nr:GLPGLI family protein [Bacteroidia bacterium]NNF81118.1 GLPGLI family protein [Flavobacteriaceae bacterium]NNK71156.1 GLPGLI family protein [Flavobacteriaceae bacterium]NNL81497.1 GLPGLI family protein [Flavobacteriaceae bacterium]
MKSILIKISCIALVFFLGSSFTSEDSSEDFQGKAYYFSKSRMELGNWGARLSEAQKKQVAARLKNRLEKTYVLVFNKEESIFDEEDKIDAISGATDSWGKNFTPGEQYKNVKSNSQVQFQEFYGKRFLVKDKLQPIEWKMGTESKKIGDYMCFKATASIPTNELTWYSFSWDRLRNNNQQNGDPAQGEEKEAEVAMTEVEAWYTLQIPVLHGPLEYWGLPGLILEISAGDTTILCSKIVMNPDEKIEIEAPDKGKVVTKSEYQKIITEKMREFRDNRVGRRR